MKALSISENKTAFRDGMRDGIPIGWGYLAVAFSLGIAARNAGLNAAQACLASLLCNASAGEYAGFTVIAANASYIEMAFLTLIANARYILMSCAMSQRMSPSTGSFHRIIMGFDITDELFGIAMARPGSLNPYYTYGAMLVSIPMWAAGTCHRHCRRKHPAAEPCQRLQRRPLRNVPRRNNSARAPRPRDMSHCCRLFCAQLCRVKAAIYQHRVRRNAYSHSYRRHLIRRRVALPSQGR